ncbi:MAG: hypothetical protein WC635_11475 [Bacteriovorax sp.]
MKKIFIVFTIFLSANAFAATCESQRASLKQSLYNKYNFNYYRSVSDKVTGSLTASEREELFTLSELFNSIPHDTPENQNDRYAWQKRAKVIIRTATRRAGFKISNPETGDPYDAKIGEVRSRDGYVEYLIEVTELLVMSIPLPHITLWFSRMDPAHNPYRIFSLKINVDPTLDVVRWVSADYSQKITGTIDQFVSTLLPAECRE